MKVTHKIGIAQAAVRSISNHDDADAALVEGALDEVSKFIETERTDLRARRAEKIAAELAAATHQETK